MKRLDDSFCPGSFDVICARGKDAKNHIGNKHFRQKVIEATRAYEQAESRLYKSLVVSSIVESIRQASPHGGFVKEIDGVWYEVGDHLAREKTGQALREQLHSHYKSSAKSKRRRRKLELEQSYFLLDAMVLSNNFIATKIEEVETKICKIGGQNASDDMFLELLNQNNTMILDAIANDPKLQQGILNLATATAIEAV